MTPSATESTIVDIEELERLAKAAQPGPWSVDRDAEYKDAAPYICSARLGYTVVSQDGVMEDDDAAFIAAANPSTVLALLCEVRAHRDGESRERSKREHELAQGWAKLRAEKANIRAGAWEEGHDATGPYAVNPYRDQPQSEPAATTEGTP